MLTEQQGTGDATILGKVVVQCVTIRECVVNDTKLHHILVLLPVKLVQLLTFLMYFIFNLAG